MEFEDFYLGQKVNYSLKKTWGSGIVDLIYPDKSILVHFPGRSYSKLKHRNMFKYYNEELKYFTESI